MAQWGLLGGIGKGLTETAAIMFEDMKQKRLVEYQRAEKLDDRSYSETVRGQEREQQLADVDSAHRYQEGLLETQRKQQLADVASEREAQKGLLQYKQKLDEPLREHTITVEDGFSVARNKAGEIIKKQQLDTSALSEKTKVQIDKLSSEINALSSADYLKSDDRSRLEGLRGQRDRLLGLQPTAKQESLMSLPDPSQHEGRIIHDTEMDVRLKSDGKNWVPVADATKQSKAPRIAGSPTGKNRAPVAGATKPVTHRTRQPKDAEPQTTVPQRPVDIASGGPPKKYASPGDTAGERFLNSLTPPEAQKIPGKVASGYASFQQRANAEGKLANVFGRTPSSAEVDAFIEFTEGNKFEATQSNVAAFKQYLKQKESIQTANR